MEKITSKSREVAAVAVFSSLYAALSLATAYIPTGPFFIQFRPAIAIPMIAAVIFGPWVAGLSAAIGTFVASIIRYGTAILTIFSGTPANFLGFYTMGHAYRLLSKRTKWTLALIVASVAGLFVGSVIIGIGLWFLARTFVPQLALTGFSDLRYSMYASFLLVYAPAPIALLIAISVVKLLGPRSISS